MYLWDANILRHFGQGHATLRLYLLRVPWTEIVELGPIASTAWEIKDVLADGFKLEAERWTVDHLDFVELSVKAKREKADKAIAAFDDFLIDLVGGTVGDASRKTERVLRWLADA